MKQTREMTVYSLFAGQVKSYFKYYQVPKATETGSATCFNTRWLKKKKKINLEKKEETKENGTISHLSDAEINASENLLLWKLRFCMCSASSFFSLQLS